MSLIKNIITLSNYEAARARLASILADEFANQIVLFEAAKAEEEAKPTPDPDLIAFYDLSIASIPSKVWEERFFRPTPTELQTEPIVNVIFTGAPLEELTTNSTQIGDDRFMVEVYTAGKDTSENKADYLASVKLQRCLAIIRTIIMDPNYRDLGFAKNEMIIGKRICSSIQIGQPDDGADNADAMIRGKIDVILKLSEFVQPIAGVIESNSETTLKLSDNKGYYWTNQSN